MIYFGILYYLTCTVGYKLHNFSELVVWYSFLGRLPKVDLIILGGKMSVRPSVHPSTKSFFDFNEIWYIGRGR